MCSTRLGLFHLHHDPGAAGRDLLRLGHVLGALDEGEADELDALLEHEGEVGAVLLGQRGDGQHHVRHVHALAVRSGPPTSTSVSRWSSRWRVTRRRSLPSSSRSVVPMRAASMISGWGSCTRRTSPGDGGEVEAEGLAGLQLHAAAARTCRRGAWGPARRPGCRSGGRCLASSVADGGDAGGVVLVGAVGEVEAEDVGAGAVQALDHLRAGRGGAEGGDHLRAAGRRRVATSVGPGGGGRLAAAAAGLRSGRSGSGGKSRMRATSSTRSCGTRRHCETAAVEMPSPLAMRVTAPRRARRVSRAWFRAFP